MLNKNSWCQNSWGKLLVAFLLSAIIIITGMTVEHVHFS